MTTPSQNPQSPYLLCFIGGQGYGKTHLAREIAKITGAPIVSNDAIRRQIEAAGEDWHNQPRVHGAAYRQVSEHLRRGQNVIIDSNALRQWPDIEPLCPRCYFVNLVCSEEVILARLREREHKLSHGEPTGDPSTAGIVDHLAYKEEIKTRHFPPEKIFFEIRTDADLAPQIAALLAKIQQDSENPYPSSP